MIEIGENLAHVLGIGMFLGFWLFFLWIVLKD